MTVCWHGSKKDPFDGSVLVVPQGVQRDRDADELSAQQLAERRRAG
jgi:hypothetical protein